MRRMRHAASSTTIDQPMPMSSRLPPVMLASASGAYLLGILARLPGEREVDRVLGQHRDERERRRGRGLPRRRAGAPRRPTRGGTRRRRPRGRSTPRPASRAGCTPVSRSTSPGTVTAAAPTSAASCKRGRGGLSTTVARGPGTGGGGHGRESYGLRVQAEETATRSDIRRFRSSTRGQRPTVGDVQAEAAQR